MERRLARVGTGRDSEDAWKGVAWQIHRMVRACVPLVVR